MFMAIHSLYRRVDAHQHFWRYTDAEFGWISDEMSLIRRDFLPEDLRPQLSGAGVDASIAVQARQSLEETSWLLGLAGQNSWIAGVVGWVPLVERDIEKQLEQVAMDSRLKGVRHVLQGEDDSFMSRDDFNTGVDFLLQHGLVYDVLVLERQLPAAMRFVDRHPNQPFVLDHIAKPLIAAGEIEPWRAHMMELSKRQHVHCKLSGLVAEADFKSWTIEHLRPYFDVVLESFGPRRLLFGSDWPVCNVATTYENWVSTAQALIGELSMDEQDLIMGLECR